jgi:hypothetical protein
MRAARLATIVALLLVAPVVATAAAKGPGAPAAPKGLKGFLLRPNESVTHTFPRTPAFAWNPVRSATCYEFQLATSRSFEDSTVVWSNVPTGKGSGRNCGPVKRFSTTHEAQDSGEVTQTSETLVMTIPPIRIPAVAINLTLPWFTGKPYALYAHVRAVTTRGATRWSAPFGFNVRWEELPVPVSTKPGLVRWRPVEGATAYQVWYPDIRKSFLTHTNVADQRELYTFHDDHNWWSTVRWRVRAVREVLGYIPNGLPAVSYGPWSPVYASTNPALTSGKLRLRTAASDVVSSGWNDSAHQLMPALTFTGNQDLTGQEWPLFRAYAFTDKDCVNTVFRGSVVGGPAFAPRIGPLKLPVNYDELDAAMVGVLPSATNETAKTFAADGTALTSSETMVDENTPPRTDLPDVDAQTTRYYWTVVPVGINVNESGTFEYVDVELPQDACAAGRVSTFAKRSHPAITAAGGAFVSGLTPKGRLLASAGRRPVVYSTPLVAWKPVLAATGYEIEWSRTKYPWRRAGHLMTQSTAAVLKLTPGLWYYRVRGMNSAQIGVSGLAWSAPLAIKVARPTFRVSSR